MIRDQIVAKRHAQYLREKVIRDVSKSRKSVGLLSSEDTVKSNILHTNNKSGGELSTPTITAHFNNFFNQSTMLHPSPGTVEILPTPTMNNDISKTVILNDKSDPLCFTNFSQQQQHYNNAQHQQLPQLSQQAYLKYLLQYNTTNPQTPCLMLNNDPSSFISNIILNNPSFIQQPGLNTNPLLNNSCPLVSNQPIKSQCPDMNFLCPTNQTDTEKLYNMLSLNLSPLTQTVYSPSLVSFNLSSIYRTLACVGT
ncbi:unnamed protein product [Trichobilharzia regenti]|nr:unnamed protein product [Trichobilharzia regenti]